MRLGARSQSSLLYPQRYQLPETYEDEDGAPSKYVISYQAADYPNVIDLLRNEGPVHFYWNVESGAACVRSGSEEDGEGDEEEFDD